jgi:hypothetical protein
MLWSTFLSMTEIVYIRRDAELTKIAEAEGLLVCCAPLDEKGCRVRRPLLIEHAGRPHVAIVQNVLDALLARMVRATCGQ